MAFSLPSLPYDLEALAPVISRTTMEYHYHKHHQGYLTKLNELIQGTPYQNLSLQEVLEKSYKAGDRAVFNNSAQAYHHGFYWEGLSPPNKDPKLSAELESLIHEKFGSRKSLETTLVQKGVAQFGSGWVWLVATFQGGKASLEVVSSSNGEAPWLSQPCCPLWVADVWEHAYYLDYYNQRQAHLDQVVSQLVDWGKVSSRLEERKVLGGQG